MDAEDAESLSKGEADRVRALPSGTQGGRHDRVGHKNQGRRKKGMTEGYLGTTSRRYKMGTTWGRGSVLGWMARRKAHGKRERSSLRLDANIAPAHLG